MNKRFAFGAGVVALGMTGAIVVTVRHERRARYCEASKDRYPFRDSPVCRAEWDAFSSSDRDCAAEGNPADPDFDQGLFNTKLGICGVTFKVTVPSGRTEQPLEGAGADFVVNSITAPATDDAWLAGTGLYRYNGWKWTRATAPFVPITAISGARDTDVWMIGNGANVAHFDGKGWSAVSVPGLAASTLVVTWPSGEAWIADQSGAIFGFDGKTWAKTNGPAGLRGLWGPTTRDVWAATDGGRAHWDGATWSATTALEEPLNAVSGSGPNDVWMAGDHGLLAHWDGHTWTTSYVGLTPRVAFRAISMWRPHHIVAIGDRGIKAEYESGDRFHTTWGWNSGLWDDDTKWRAVATFRGTDTYLLGGAMGPRVFLVNP